MRGKHGWAVGVREPDGGLYTEEHPLSKKGNRPKWFSWPLVRGCVALVDSLVLGFKALEIAVNNAFDEEDESYSDKQKHVLEKADETFLPSVESSSEKNATPSEVLLAKNPSMDESGSAVEEVSAAEIPAEEKLGAKNFAVNEALTIEDISASNTKLTEGNKESDEGILSKGEMTFALILGLVLAIALFILLPALASNVLVGEYEQNPFVWNIVDGLMRVIIFIFYVWLIGRMPDIKRMFAYHGAEHKTIHCYEHGMSLTPENAKQFPRLHVRCGTAFLIMVMLIAILVYTAVPLDAAIDALGISGPAAFVLLLVVRIALMPVIAGVSYEITVKWAGSHPDNPLVRVVLWPGMQMQRLTTNEPDEGMLECAIAAMNLVINQEERPECDKRNDCATSADPACTASA